MNNDVNYISQEGLDKIKQELKERKEVIRPQIAERLSAAKDQGDLSENFDYQDSKDQQAENERIIFNLEEQIHRAVLVEQKTGGKISIGSSFKARMANGEEKSFEIVGPTETDPMNGKISNESPLGKAFLGKKEGEKANFKTPSGSVEYTVLSIQ